MTLSLVGGEILITNWSVGQYPEDGYTSPEQRWQVLRGNVYGHPNHEDGEKIRTSAIILATGTLVQTEKRLYRLGTIEAEYRKWLDDNGYEYDEANPVTMGAGSAKRKVTP